MATSKFKNSSGFTLIELLVVSVLLAILAGLLYSTINGIIQARTIVEAEIESTSKAHYVIERIGRELTSILPKQLQFDSKSAPTTFTTIVFTGENKKGRDGPRDSITFVSAVGGQVIPGQNSNYGNVQITYRLDKNSRKLGDKKTYKLIREEFPAEVIDKKTRELRKLSFPIAEDVISLNFRFLNLGKWLDTWDQNQTNFPEAVEMTILFQDIEGQTKGYRTAYALRRGTT